MKTKIIYSMMVLTLSGLYLFGQTQFQPSISGLQAFIENKPVLLEDEIFSTTEKINSLEMAYAQSADSTSAKPVKPDTGYVAPERYKTRIPQSLYVPSAMIIYGLTITGNHGLYSSEQARKDIMNLTNGKGSHIDNFLIIAPYVEFGLLLAFKVKCKNDFVNTTLLIVKSEVLMLAILYPMKYLTHEERPYSYQKGIEGTPIEIRKESAVAFQSMPSGHTAESFLAATIVNKEFRYISPWYGIGAYALATTTGIYRIINDQHWLSDVLVGAGIGILSANIVYATHQHRWGRNEVCFTPLFDGTSKGLLFTFRF